MPIAAYLYLYLYWGPTQVSKLSHICMHDARCNLELGTCQERRGVVQQRSTLVFSAWTPFPQRAAHMPKGRAAAAAAASDDNDDDDGVDLGFTLAGEDDEEEEEEKETVKPAAKLAAPAASDDRAAVIKRHRKEEQQLRAEAKQKLFGVAKGDKAARAAAEAERDAALQEMAERHALELGEDPSVTAAADGLATLSATGSAGGSKAGGKKKSQRQKKEEAERAREKRIADHHAGAGPSERDIEMGKLTAQLQPLGKRIVEIPADGHCLYRSLAHQLQAHGDGGCDFAACRREIAQHMRQHPSDFVPFLAETGATDLEAYCQVVEGSSEWGGQLEITAMAHARRTMITIYSADAPPLTTGEEYSGAGTLELAYHRHYFGLGERAWARTRHCTRRRTHRRALAIALAPCPSRTRTPLSHSPARPPARLLPTAPPQTSSPAACEHMEKTRMPAPLLCCLWPLSLPDPRQPLLAAAAVPLSGTRTRPLRLRLSSRRRLQRGGEHWCGKHRRRVVAQWVMEETPPPANHATTISPPPPTAACGWVTQLESDGRVTRLLPSDSIS